MKSRLALLSLLAPLLALSVALSPPVAEAADPQTAFSEGVRLYNQGEYAGALALFEMILRQRPDNVYARSYAARSRAAMAQNQAHGGRGRLQEQLQQIVIPELNLTDAPIGDVLDYLSKRAEEISEGKTTVNFIFKGTPEQRQEILITLSVRNVPMTEAIRYVGQLGRTRISYEQFAVVVDARPQTADQSGPGEQPDAQQGGGDAFNP